MTQVPDYYTIVQKPICLQDIVNKLKRRQYPSMTECEDDLMLIFANCAEYNGECVHADVSGSLKHTRTPAFSVSLRVSNFLVSVFYPSLPLPLLLACLPPVSREDGLVPALPRG